MSTPPPCGRHLLADLHGCADGLDDPRRIERALRAGVAAAQATLIALKLHHFGDRHGVTGVALLAESHISIHTWPEHGYAAVDIFLCGEAHDITAALDALCAGLAPARRETRLFRRGFSSLQPAT